LCVEDQVCVGGDLGLDGMPLLFPAVMNLMPLFVVGKEDFLLSTVAPSTITAYPQA